MFNLRFNQSSEEPRSTRSSPAICWATDRNATRPSVSLAAVPAPYLQPMQPETPAQRLRLARPRARGETANAGNSAARRANESWLRLQGPNLRYPPRWRRALLWYEARSAE